MLYKYLFYWISYYVKKYDNLWNVGETYYIGGALMVGLTINITILDIYRLLGILWWQNWFANEITLRCQICSLIIPITIAILLGVTGKHQQIYDTVANLSPVKKRTYKILNIIHLLAVYGFMFISTDYIRYYINGYDSMLFIWLENLIN